MYLILNHKMNLDPAYMIEYRNCLEKLDVQDTTVVVCPSVVFLPYFKKDKVHLGSQDVSTCESGSFTGEVSAHYLKSMDVEYGMIHHYERIKYFNETSEMALLKIEQLKKRNITPILCISSSSISDYEGIEQEIDDIYGNIEEKSKCILAYESIRAIESGVMDDFDKLQEMIFFIKKYVKDKYQIDITLLYGGNVNEKTIHTLRNLEGIDGFVMGKDAVHITSVREVLKEIHHG